MATARSATAGSSIAKPARSDDHRQAQPLRRPRSARGAGSCSDSTVTAVSAIGPLRPHSQSVTSGSPWEPFCWWRSHRRSVIVGVCVVMLPP